MTLDSRFANDASARSAEPLLSVSTWIAKPGREHDLEEIGRRLMSASSQFEGHLSGTVLHEPSAPEYHFAQSFAGRRQLERWLDSPERRDLLNETEAAAKRVQGPQKITGLETWFASNGRHVSTIKPPPRWKMWLASLLGAYPLVVLFQWQLASHLDGLPLLVRSAVFPVILLSVMTYLMMPLVTRLLRHWLYPGPGPGG